MAAPIRRRVLQCVALFLLAASNVVSAADATAGARLRAKYTELAAQLANNPFKRPLVMRSSESGNVLKGDVYAVIDHPLTEVSSSLSGPTHWCDVLVLHLNTKYCHASDGPNGTVLDMRIGKKFDQPIESAYHVDFEFRPGSSTAEYFDSHLEAKKGPLGTSDYRILLEGVAVAGKKTFIHLTYSYAYGFASKIAMRGYLATVGSGKVGFSSTPGDDGQPEFIGGMRGVIERTTMRYYLAIDAYLNALTSAPAQQVEKRLVTWFDTTEQYPHQLHEMDREAYLEMKRSEIQRQQTAQ